MKISKYSVKELGPGAKVRIIRRDIGVLGRHYADAFNQGRILTVTFWVSIHSLWNTDGGLAFTEREIEVV